VSVPAHALNLYLRALRWRHLTDPVQRIGTAPLFRAMSVGFMVNNLFPLRVGEVARAWYLSRETGAPAAALLGTVILERVIDTLVVVAMAAVVLALGDFARAGVDSTALVVSLVVLAVVPIAGVVALRVAPRGTVRVFVVVARPILPERTLSWAEGQLGRLVEGLGALRGGRHLFWLTWHSIWIWIGASVVPFYVAIVALGIDLGSAWVRLEAAYVVLVFVGAAVALPSAPGFFGPYHAACRVALSAFQVPAVMAVALGTLCHAIFWVTVTLMGLGVLRFRGTSLATVEAAAEASEDEPLEGR
jgi:uncharacterized protein (TIRG00374 family)